MMRQRLVQGMAGVMLLGSTAAGQDLVWDGDCGTTTWHQMCGAQSNWDNDSVPTPADNAIISGFDVSLGNMSATVNDFFLTSGSIGMAAGQVLIIDGTGLISNSTAGGKLISNSTMTFSGSSTHGGTLAGVGTIYNIGTWTMNDGMFGENTLFPPTVFENQANATLRFEPQIFQNATYRNFGTTTFEVGGVAGAGMFENYGNIFYGQGAVAVIGAPFHQFSGTATAALGELRISNTSQYSGGDIEVQAGALLHFHGVDKVHEFDGLTSIHGSGEARFGAGPTFGLKVTQPLEVDLDAPGYAAFNNVGDIDNTLTNRGQVRFNNARFFGTSPGGFVNDFDGSMELTNNVAPMLRTDVPVTTWGVALSRSPIAALTIPTVAVTNEISGTWDMLVPPASSVDFLNKGQVYRRDVGAILVTPSTVPCPYDQDGGTTTLEDNAQTTFNAGGTWSNGSELIAVAPAEARFNGGTYTFDGSGNALRTQANLVTPTGGEIQLDSGQFIVNGTLELHGGPRLECDTQTIQIGMSVVGSGTIENHGDAELTGTGQIGDGTTAAGTFLNLGYLKTSFLGNPPGETDISMTFDNQGTVGQVDWLDLGPGSVTNSGTWNINGNKPTVHLSGSATFLNTGNFIVGYVCVSDGPPCTQIDIPFDNQGTLEVEADNCLVFNVAPINVQVDSLGDGQWRADPLGMLVFPVSINTIGSGCDVEASTTSMPDLSSVGTCQGDLTLNDDCTFEGGMNVEDSGTFTVDDNSTCTFGGGANNGNGGSILSKFGTRQVVIPLAGGGCPTAPHVIAPTFDNHAILEPGVDGEIAGMMIQAVTTLHPTSTLRIDVEGLAPCTGHDQLIIDGAATVGGTIEVTLQNAYEPALGDSFVVLTATGSVSGAIDDVDSPVFGDGLRFHATTNAGDVTLTVGCAADLDFSGAIDVVDLLAVLAGWGTPDADVDGDDDTTVTDLLAVLGDWGPCS